ncbi:MAG: DUF2169 domain-containing protein, partial [Myxococcota bacterium]
MRVLSPDTPDIVVGSLLYRAQPGTWSLAVVAKLGERLSPGRCAPVAAPALSRRDHFHDGPRSSLRTPRDLVPPKPRPEYVVVGSAFAPEATQELTVGVRLGTHHKRLHVTSVRRATDGDVHLGPPWTQRPLRWELTARSEENPVGVPRGGVNLASILPLAGVGAAGFGPLRADWPSRSKRLDGRRIDEDALHGVVLGEDFDRRYFQIAPADQWLDVIAPDQAFDLQHLPPNHAKLSTRLSGRRPVARVQRSGASIEVPLVADTLVIDTDEDLVTTIWRGEVSLERANEAGVVRVGLWDGSDVLWPPVAADAAADDDDDVSSAPGSSNREETLDMNAQTAQRVRAETSTNVLSEELIAALEAGTAPTAGPAWLQPRRPAPVPPASGSPPSAAVTDLSSAPPAPHPARSEPPPAPPPPPPPPRPSHNPPPPPPP